jgi:hypothetical protein
MDHSQSVTSFDMTAHGAEDISRVNGALKPGSFARMLSYLQWTRLLDLRVPAGEGAGVNISLVRGSKVKSVRLRGNGATVNAAAWTTLSLVQSLAQEIDWKNAQGLSLNTVYFSSSCRAQKDCPNSPQ